MNRVRVIVNGQPNWVSIPIVRSYHGLRLIKEMYISRDPPWRKKLLKTIELSYRCAPYFDTVFPLLSRLIENPTDELSEFNLTVIRALAAAIGLEPSKLILGSSIITEGNATDLLIAMVQAVRGDAYLCGGGAEGYQEDEKFAAAGITLIYQSFEHPVYPQTNIDTFCPGLSVIDALMNCGFEKAHALVSLQQARG